MLGCDRELLLTAALGCSLIAYCTASGTGVACAVVLWLVIVYLLQRMAKEDVLMRMVARRERNYAGHYPAKSGLHSVIREAPRNWS